MMYSLGRVGVVCKGMGVRASVGGQGCGCDLGGGLTDVDWLGTSSALPTE